MSKKEDTIIYLKKGDTLITEGENSTSLYWVIEGQFQVSTKITNLRVTVNEIGPGELIGELSFIDQKPRSATVKALTDAQVIKLEYEEFAHMMEQMPKWLNKIMHTLAQKVRKLSTIE